MNPNNLRTTIPGLHLKTVPFLQLHQCCQQHKTCCELNLSSFNDETMQINANCYTTMRTNELNKEQLTRHLEQWRQHCRATVAELEGVQQLWEDFVLAVGFREIVQVLCEVAEEGSDFVGIFYLQVDVKAEKRKCCRSYKTDDDAVFK